ncbi:unnamed protein product [Caenorhabditis auriculariae]|uniref:Uncharacterized protein n=1 Tax=Caenorhabditis auriculariae TaxID=2777116 RepID=A0A8S1H508_9PELO|nr:unnamed protein product [Caenorhabditis auriculariae]
MFLQVIWLYFLSLPFVTLTLTLCKNPRLETDANVVLISEKQARKKYPSKSPPPVLPTPPQKLTPPKDIPLARSCADKNAEDTLVNVASLETDKNESFIKPIKKAK